MKRAVPLLALVPALVLAGCFETEPALSLPTQRVIAHAASGALNAVALGDIHPELPGLEIVVVAADGRVIVVRRAGGRWRSSVAFHAPGELLDVVCADLVPSHPGDEILAVGAVSGSAGAEGEGAVWLGTRHRGRGFEGRLLCTTPTLQRTVVVGDFEASNQSPVVLTAGDDGDVRSIALGADFTATERVVASLSGAARGACVMGPSALFACANGRLVQLARGDGGDLGATLLFEHTSGLAWPAVHGELLLAAAEDGALLTWHLGSARGAEPVSLRGAPLVGVSGAGVVGEFDATSAGDEALVSDHEGRVLVLRLRSGGPAGPVDVVDVVELAAPGPALLDFVVGDVLPEHPGDEFVAVGTSGEVYVFMR